MSNPELQPGDVWLVNKDGCVVLREVTEITNSCVHVSTVGLDHYSSIDWWTTREVFYKTLIERYGKRRKIGWFEYGIKRELAKREKGGAK